MEIFYTKLVLDSTQDFELLISITHSKIDLIKKNIIQCYPHPTTNIDQTKKEKNIII